MIYEPYLHEFGTSFGFTLTPPIGTGTGTITQAQYEAIYKPKEIFKGIYTESHSGRDLGLYPRSKPRIISPELQLSGIEVPGRNGRLDTTEALDGMQHYFNSEGVFEFTAIGRENWSSAYFKLRNKLHGKKMPIVLDEEPDGYYVGRLTVDEPEYDHQSGEAFFTVTADMEPFKYSFDNVTNGEWLWDPFCFPTGIIRNYHHIEIGEDSISVQRSRNPLPRYADINTVEIPGKTMVIYGTAIPTVPNIVVSSGTLSVTYIPAGSDTPKTVALTIGDNEDKMDDLILSDDSGTELTFIGTGTIAIEMKTGWL